MDMDLRWPWSHKHDIPVERCLSSDGKVLPVSANADPSFFGAGQLRAGYIQL
jgi:hypothetical protein